MTSPIRCYALSIRHDRQFDPEPYFGAKFGVIRDYGTHYRWCDENYQVQTAFTEPGEPQLQFESVEPDAEFVGFGERGELIICR